MTWRRCGAAILAVLAALPAAASDPSLSIDHYVLALSWQPTFCRFNADKPECRALGQADFAATHLAIHGLWPDLRESKRLRYCGVDEHIELMDQRSRWCELPAPEISDETRAELGRAMPGVHSCLDRHEWIEHGTCAKMSAESYFSITLRLAAAVRASPLGDMLAANVSREVPRRKLVDAFEAGFGPGAGKALTLLCKPSGAASLLIEIRITLELSAMDGDLGAEDLRPTTGGTAGSCPALILIDPVGP
ncbi:MAG TPA: ribonuclease T2 [Dongiaceae bacterium]|nr:ribonuclease T2 [Dongiaceae bacterium]